MLVKRNRTETEHRNSEGAMPRAGPGSGDVPKGPRNNTLAMTFRQTQVGVRTLLGAYPRPTANGSTGETPLSAYAPPPDASPEGGTHARESRVAPGRPASQPAIFFSSCPGSCAALRAVSRVIRRLSTKSSRQWSKASMPSPRAVWSLLVNRWVLRSRMRLDRA